MRASRYYVKYHGEVTITREALVEKLVVSLHLNVPERQTLGSDCDSVEEVAAVVKRLFEQGGYFPPIARLWQPGELCFEGFILVKLPDGKIQMAWQRSNPIDSKQLAEQSSSEFSDLDEAISAFIDSQWPKGIDGIALSPQCRP
jgi:hypothetical protein